MSENAFRLDGKVALVTGGARGIGAACARALGNNGAAVFVTDVLEELGLGTVESLRADGIRAGFARHDVRKEEEWEAVVAKCVETLGGLDVLVNNAGIEQMAPITEMSLADWRKIQEVNVDGVFLGMKHAMRAMRPGGAAGRGGSIVNLSSIAGMIGATGLTAYCASKGAVRLMTKAAAVEAGQFRLGVRVNSVHPGLIQTNMLTNLFEEMVKLAGLPNTETGAEAFFAQQPVKEARLQPEDIANIVLFLASDASRHVTGSEYVCDAGFTAT